ncbi:MAG: hypothetical protein R2880_02350 [Deinococcales bacterium]
MNQPIPEMVMDISYRLGVFKLVPKLSTSSRRIAFLVLRVRARA